MSFTVALVGADGAGKTTVAEQLGGELPFPSAYMYMGVSQVSSNRLLPTTQLVRWYRRRAGVVERGPSEPTSASGPRPVRQQVRAALRTGNRMAEETYRQFLTWRELRRGKVVIFDRHFFADYYIADVRAAGTRPWSSRVHGFFLRHVLPRPDLVIFLDAPAEVLFARKGEGTVELLERLRTGYAELEHAVDHFARVDVTRPLDVVVAAVTEIIVTAHSARSD